MSKKMDRCSFCGRTEREVAQLFQGPGDVFICDSCVESCHSLLRDDMYSLAREYENLRDGKPHNNKNYKGKIENGTVTQSEESMTRMTSYGFPHHGSRFSG